MTDPRFALLMPAARIEFDPEHQALLVQAAQQFSDWRGFVEYAEHQRMGPLFYHHTRAAGAGLPDEVRLALQGLYLRHQAANRARLNVLAEILPACKQAGLDVVLLKGAALFSLIYPQPALRPMRDLDLLTRPAQAEKLHRLLRDLGYAPVATKAGRPESARHLPELRREMDGFQISIEAHHSLFDPTWRVRPPDIDSRIDRARPFDLNGVPARTLSPEDMLWHIYQHMINEEIRLISIVDLLGIAEFFVAEIDWQRVWREMPAIPKVLGMFHALSPLSETLLAQAGIPAASSAVDFSEDLQGWPRVSITKAREIGAGQLLLRTLYPPTGWLRLYYAVPPPLPLIPYQIITYPLELLRQVGLRLNKSPG